MLGWLKKKTTFLGSVYFRGPMPPRAEEFAYLEKRGIRVSQAKPREGTKWGLKLTHPEWGEARLVCLDKRILPPREAVEYDRGLTKPEKQDILAARSSVHVRRESDRENVLREIMAKCRAGQDE